MLHDGFKEEVRSSAWQRRGSQGKSSIGDRDVNVESIGFGCWTSRFVGTAPTTRPPMVVTVLMDFVLRVTRSDRAQARSPRSCRQEHSGASPKLREEYSNHSGTVTSMKFSS
jgi:hypothetical protein